MVEATITLLRAGVTLSFPSGYVFTPDLDTNYIDLAFINETGDYSSDGLEALSIEGVKRAYEWKEIFENENL